MRKGELTDIGKRRSHNEDSFYSYANNKYYYAMVADGMGGHFAGEIASNMAIYEIKKYFANHFKDDMDCFQVGEVVKQAFIKANTAVYEYAKQNLNVMGMGTTVTFAMVYGDKIISANVGDSRTYIINDREIKQITRDHSYVAELVARGQITPQQAKNHPKRSYITRAVGTEETVDVDINYVSYDNETVLLCSDGLSNLVEDKEIQNIVGNKKNLGRCAKKLVALANHRGGTDNITVVLYRKDR